jgi:hypothetical protein
LGSGGTPVAANETTTPVGPVIYTPFVFLANGTYYYRLSPRGASFLPFWYVAGAELWSSP